MQVAEILGMVETGKELSQRVMSEVAAAQGRAAQALEQPRVAYLYTRGPSVLLLFGRGLPTQAMIEGAGAIDIGAALGEGAIPLTPEALITAAPDMIVLPRSVPSVGPHPLFRSQNLKVVFQGLSSRS